MRCACCGEWVIDEAVLDGVPRLRLKHGPYLIGAGYYTSPTKLASALARHGGPKLEEFEPLS